MQFRFGEFVLDTRSGDLVGPQGPVSLRRQTFRLLEVLVGNAPELIERDRLLDEAWGRTALSTNVVPQAISELRQALGDQASAPKYIETLHRRGYRMICPVERMDSPDPPMVRQMAGKRSLIIAFGALLTMILTGVLWLLWPQHNDAQTLITTSETDTARAMVALGVFPHQAEIPDWLPIAALELLTQQLAADQRVLVLRSDGLGLSGERTDARWQHLVRELLGAPLAVTGHWRHLDNQRLRLDINLIDLESGRQLHGSQHTSALEDIDHLIAQAADQLRSHLDLPIISWSTRQSLNRDQRQSYWRALAYIQQGEYQLAVEFLSNLYQSNRQPAWLAPDLARALGKTGQREQAIKLLESVRDSADQTGGLGFALRLRAELARLRHQPDEVATALRALTALFPDEAELLLELANAELDSLNGDAARALLMRLREKPFLRGDPRLFLLESRLASLDADLDRATEQANSARQLAREFGLAEMEMTASLALSSIHLSQGQLSTALEILEEASQAWQQQHSSPHFRIHLKLINTLRSMGDGGGAAALIEDLRQLDLPSDIQHRLVIERALLMTDQGELDNALTTLHELHFSEDLKYHPEVDLAYLSALGRLLAERGDSDQARDIFDQARRLAQRTGQSHDLAGIKVNTGLLLATQRRFEEADTLWTEALSVFEQVGDQRGIGLCLSNLAASASARGLEQRSLELHAQALEIFRNTGMTSHLARTSYNLALLASRRAELAQAINLFSEAHDNYLATDNINFALAAGARWADMLIATGDLEAASAVLDSLLVHLEHASPLRKADWHSAYGRLEKWQGNAEAALEAWARAHDLQVEANARPWSIGTDLQRLHLELLTGKEASTVRLAVERHLRTIHELNQPRLRAQAQALIAETLLAQVRPDEARLHIQQAHMALSEMPDVLVEVRLDWLAAWTEASMERQQRLEALAQRAQGLGLEGRLLMIEQALGRQPGHDGGRLTVLMPDYALITLQNDHLREVNAPGSSM